jgi:hypothetical protein
MIHVEIRLHQLALLSDQILFVQEQRHTPGLIQIVQAQHHNGYLPILYLRLQSLPLRQEVQL